MSYRSEEEEDGFLGGKKVGQSLLWQQIWHDANKLMASTRKSFLKPFHLVEVTIKW